MSEKEIKKRIEEIEDEDVMVVMTGLGGFIMSLPEVVIEVVITKNEDSSIMLVHGDAILRPSQVADALATYDQDIDPLSTVPALWFEKPQEAIAVAQIIQKKALENNWGTSLQITEE